MRAVAAPVQDRSVTNSLEDAITAVNSQIDEQEKALKQLRSQHETLNKSRASKGAGKEKKRKLTQLQHQIDQEDVRTNYDPRCAKLRDVLYGSDLWLR